MDENLFKTVVRFQQAVRNNLLTEHVVTDMNGQSIYGNNAGEILRSLH